MFVLDRVYLESLSEKDKNNLTIMYEGELLTFWDERDYKGVHYYRVPRYYMNLPEGIEDKRTDGEDIEIELNPDFKPLNEYQENAINVIVNNSHGLVSARVGFGKTYVAINSITQIKKRTLIIVHVSTKDGLMDQWKNSIIKYTNLTEDDIGILTSKTKVIDKPVYLTTVQTLDYRVKKEDVEFAKMMYLANFGVVFFDECHITASSSKFSECTKILYAKRMYGLSATLVRKDSLASILNWNLGEVIYDDGIWFVLPIYVAMVDIPIKLGGYAKYLSYSNPSSWGAMYAKFLSKKEEYIKALAKIVDDCLDSGRNPLILSSQIEILYKILKECKHQEEISIVHSKVENKDYEKRCIFATLGMFKVGMDVPRLDTLIFATPLTAKNGLIQAIGRVARVCRDRPDKKVLLVDIANSTYSKTLEMRSYRERYYNEINMHSTKDCLIVDAQTPEDLQKLYKTVLAEGEKVND